MKLGYNGRCVGLGIQCGTDDIISHMVRKTIYSNETETETFLT